MLDTRQIIHIVVEIIVLAGLFFFVIHKHKQLSTQISDLYQRLNEQDEIIHKHETLLAKQQATIDKLLSIISPGVTNITPNNVPNNVPLSNNVKVPNTAPLPNNVKVPNTAPLPNNVQVPNNVQTKVLDNNNLDDGISPKIQIVKETYITEPTLPTNILEFISTQPVILTNKNSSTRIEEIVSDNEAEQDTTVVEKNVTEVDLDAELEEELKDLN